MRILFTISICVALAVTAETVDAQGGHQPVGLAPKGEVAFEYVGMVRQVGFQFETYGYFTYIRDLPDALLFFNPNARSEKTARFTFHSRTKMTSRSIAQKVFNLSVKGEMTVYVRQQPARQATLERGDDFRSENTLASFEVRGQSVVAVTSPNVGIHSALLEVKQTSKGWKLFGDEQNNYRFGQPNSLLRFSHIGRGEKGQDEPILATIAIAGRAISVDPDPPKN